MSIEEERFHRRLRRYDRHKMSLAAAYAMVAVGMLSAPSGLPLIVASGLFFVLAGWMAMKGGRSALPGKSWRDFELFGLSFYRDVRPRDMEAMSNQERLDDARLAGLLLIVFGLVVVMAGIAFTFYGWRLQWYR